MPESLIPHLKTYPIQTVCPTEDLARIISLRKKVWDWAGQVRSVQSWRDPLDDIAIHFVVFHDQQIIAAARLLILDEEQIRAIPRFAKYLELDQYFQYHWRFPIGFFSRLVVDPDFQGQGIAKALIEKRLDYLKTKNIPTAILTSQHPRILKGVKQAAWNYACPVASDRFLSQTGLQSHLYFQQFP